MAPQKSEMANRPTMIKLSANNAPIKSGLIRMACSVGTGSQLTIGCSICRSRLPRLLDPETGNQSVTTQTAKQESVQSQHPEHLKRSKVFHGMSFGSWIIIL
eukprot:455452-Amphidinium_carterae.1